MPRAIKKGRTSQILLFIQAFSAENGFGPTIREIGSAVGLRSTSTVAGYLNRMSKAGLISSIPSSPRSIQVIEQEMSSAVSNDGSSLLQCKFRFPDGTYPTSVIALVTDKEQRIVTPVSAEAIELIHTEPLIDVR